MRYRALSVAHVHEIVGHLVAGEHVAVDVKAVERGDGEVCDLEPLAKVIAVFQNELTLQPPHDVEVFEGRLAAAVHPLFHRLPVEVLDDPGFWRYVSVKYFWWYISWREAKPIAAGNFKNLVDATLPAEQIPLRMYLRTKAIERDGDVTLAGQLEKSTDFWRSHITRVRLASAPVVARAFAEAKRDDRAIGRLTTDPLRRVARRLNRTWANINLDLYSKEEAEKLVAETIEAEA